MSQTYENHYNQLLQILRDNRRCWEQEILNSYPQSITTLPKQWLESMASLSRHDLWMVDSKQDFSSIHHSPMRECFEQLERLTQINAKEIPPAHEYNIADAYFGVRGKKRHEIETLAPVLKILKDTKKINKVVDIGGGQGHLGRVISKHFGIPTLSVDRDPHLLALGHKNVARLQHRTLPDGAASMEFLEFTLNQELSPACFDKDALVLGLHTCGDLACHLIHHATQAQCQGMLSFGCCYSKMELDKDGYAIHGPSELKLDQHTLTLATRGHRSNSRKAFDLKLQVKRHRYSLHLFHYHQRGVERFFPMGETVPREYIGPFSEYAKHRLEAYNIQATSEELDEFYELDWVKEKFETMLMANLIRWQFGRALELVILIDRCRKLEKQGYQVELASYFDELKSPRNLGILALKK
tara:strand:+ start:14067 stop:15302 length:1236 start_codon:yes stop_codon:yes gene_type:complete